MESSKPVVLLLGDYEHALANSPALSDFSRRADLRIYKKDLSGDNLIDALGPTVIGIVLMRDRTPFGAAQLDAAPNLRFLIYTGARNGTLDEEACKARGVPVFNTKGGPSKASTTELTWALILASMKRMEAGFKIMRDPKVWTNLQAVN